MVEGIGASAGAHLLEAAAWISTSYPAGLKFRGERQDLEEMVGNLLDNACKWAKSRVWVTATRAGGASEFEVLVDDNGAGLTEENGRGP